MNYSPWNLRLDGVTSRYELVEGREHGEGIVVRLAGIDDRDAAAALTGADIEIERGQLDAPGTNEFYWTDLEGMEVRTPAGEVLGVVDHLFETGANDVMVVVGVRRLLVPFVYGRVILAVDAERRVITADWHDDA